MDPLDGNGDIIRIIILPPVPMYFDAFRSVFDVHRSR